MEQPKLLSRETLIPLSVVLMALSLIITGVVTVTNMRADISFLKLQGTSQEARIVTLENDRTTLNSRLATIETKIDLMMKALKIVYNN